MLGIWIWNLGLSLGWNSLGCGALVVVDPLLLPLSFESCFFTLGETHSGLCNLWYGVIHAIHYFFL